MALGASILKHFRVYVFIFICFNKKLGLATPLNTLTFQVLSYRSSGSFVDDVLNCQSISARINSPSSLTAFPFTLRRGFFYPQNLACTPKNDEAPYMLLYIEGTKIMNKTKCTPN